MFNQLSENLEGVFKKLRGQGKISEKNVSDAMREVRLALLEADVEFSVAKEFIARVKERATPGRRQPWHLNPGWPLPWSCSNYANAPMAMHACG